MKTRLIETYQRAALVQVRTHIGLVALRTTLPVNGLVTILDTEDNREELDRANAGRQFERLNLIGASVRVLRRTAETEA